jgi:hypothetical protein
MSAGDAPETPKKFRGVPWAAVILGALALLLALVVGREAVGVLFGVVNPPLPPLPAGLREISHRNEAYGVDTWRYVSADEACAVVETFSAEGAACFLNVLPCDARMSQSRNVSVARCQGVLEFSIFRMVWSALIFATGSEAKSSEVEVRRQIQWAN